MKRRLWLSGLLLAVVLLALHQEEAASSVGVRLPPAVPTPSPRLSHLLMGAGSCAASACHSGHFSQDSRGGELTLWASRDRHAKAYEVLFDPRSEGIQKLLHSPSPAHKDQRCLNCHVSPDIDAKHPPENAPYFKTDGVSCESCHGPAKNWLDDHHLDAWKFKTPAEKQKLGMNDLESTLGRVKVCASCHVGTPEMNVDHDLIAAGHPRLNFEFTAFHAHMPHHWPDAKDRDPTRSSWGRSDFEAHAWVVGQLVSTQTALTLLANRAQEGDHRVWPEFSEHDCFACHHDLRAASWRHPHYLPGKGEKIIPFSDWYTSMTPRALKTVHADADLLADLHKQLQSGWSNRRKIAQSAAHAAEELKGLLDRIEQKPMPPVSAEALFRTILMQDGKKAVQSWDDAAQLFLALEAMQPAPSTALHQLVGSIEFPKNYIRPGGFDPDAVRLRILELKKISRQAPP